MVMMMMMIIMIMIMISPYQTLLSDNAYFSLMLFLAQVGRSLILIIVYGDLPVIAETSYLVEALTFPVAYKQ